VNKIPKLKYPIRLDIACGFFQWKKDDGYIGIDMRDFGQEIVWDVTKGLPLPDNSVKEFFCSHLLEHLTFSQAVELFKEIWRVGIDISALELRVPSLTNRDAQAGDHKTIYTATVIEYMLREFNKEKDTPYSFIYPSLKETEMAPYDEVQAEIIIIKKDNPGG
jgi:predicted SAM-dependent methyltransferase